MSTIKQRRSIVNIKRAVIVRLKHVLVAAIFVAVSLIAAPWFIDDAEAACNPATIKVPAELVGKNDGTPLALKDGEYLIGVYKGITGPVELYVRIQKGQWAEVFGKVRGVKRPVLLDKPAPPEVEKCIESMKPSAGIAPRLRDFFLPSAEAGRYTRCGSGARCISFIMETSCYTGTDGNRVCYEYIWCVKRKGDTCYSGRMSICGATRGDSCPQ
jgi:hypothetical protein